MTVFSRQIDVSAYKNLISHRNILLLFIAVCLLVLPKAVLAKGDIQHIAFLYKNELKKKPETVFSPHDKIFLYVKFLNLPKGTYGFQADWYNAFGEKQDTSSFEFELEKKNDFAIESWLKMNRAGPMRRLFSVSETSGYHVKFIGKWRIDIFLNGQLVTKRVFTVQ